MGNSHSNDHRSQGSTNDQTVKCQHSHDQKGQDHQCLKETIRKQNVLSLPQFGGQVTVDKQRKIILRQIQILQFQQKFTLSLLTKRAQLKHQNFITVKQFRLQDCNHNHKDAQSKTLGQKLYFCYPKTKTIIIQFQPAILNINTLIKSYCQQRKPIQQQQIRRVIKSVVNCLVFLKQNQTFHGDIKPATIFIHPKTRQIQLIDSFLLNNGKTSFQIVKQNPRAESFLTPEQLQKSKNKIPDTLQRIYESQVFCLGLTLIQMMTFQASMEAYNLQLLEIKAQFIPRKLVQMQQYGYSYQLADLALRCMHKNPHLRPKFEQILRTL